MPKASSLQLRDFHGGRYAGYSINGALVPDYTVSDCLNVNFDTMIGSAVVRLGTTKVGASVTAGSQTPLGMSTFVTKKGTVYTRPIAVFSGASTATVYYFNGSWNASGLTNLNNTNRVRFEMLGNQMFLVNGLTFQSSSDGGATWSTTTNVTAITPGIVIRAKTRLLVSGDTTSTRSPSRVYFSSVVDPTQSPGSITWNTQATTGNWIDINPDDGDANTAFANTSTYTLVFKNFAMYRLNVINLSVDPDNIFNVGAPSQEAVTTCQGIVYFFSGFDIRRTTGDFPEQISRLGVQDFIDAIPQANWSQVYASNDGLNVSFSIGNITLNKNQNNQVTYNNVVLKFSPRDQSWSVHSYGNLFQAFTNISTTTLTGYALLGADTFGNVQQINNGLTDNGKPIFFELYTQSQDFGNRAHIKTITDKAVFYTKFGQDSAIQLYPDDKDGVSVPSAQNLNSRVNIADNINVRFNFLRFRWFGNSSGVSPVFEGLYVENVNDEGIVK